METSLGDLIGIPFSSLNCAELAIEVFRRYKINLPRYEFSKIAEDAAFAALREEKINSEIGSGWDEIKTPKIPCLIVLKSSSGFFDHLGVYIGGGRFIHSERKTGVVTSSLESPVWKKRIKGFYSFRG